MENDFETLIAGFIENKIGIAEHFLNDDLTHHLKLNLLELLKNKVFKAAGTGNETILNKDTAIRSDSIYWLDRKHNDKYENEFFDKIEEFIKYLNQNCYSGITDYEFHYSLYEAGSFYKKHLDQFRNNSSRQYSMISYLNIDWKASDGGELLIHHLNCDQKISPTQGKTVFFKSSELTHEVLLTTQRRMSITGWLKQ